VSVCVCVCLSGYTFPQFSMDLLQIWREPSTGHDTFRVRVCIRLFFYGLSKNLLGTYYYSPSRTSIKDYVLFIFTHRAHACDRVCARACVIKHSLIYGQTLFKIAVNILQIRTSSMGYVLFMFTHRAHACERSGAWLKHALIFGGILFKLAGHILQMTTRYMGYTLTMFTHRGHTRV
jgi:hypothetical protein